MPNLSYLIEAFLLETLGEDDSLRISRNELANYFSVAPSQINYVLSTRFTPDRGYVIESRRGGGGSVTVVRIRSGGNQFFDEVMHLPINEGLSYTRACHVIDRMQSDGIISEREARIIKSAVSDKALVVPTVMQKDGLRASIIKSVLTEALKDKPDTVCSGGNEEE